MRPQGHPATMKHLSQDTTTDARKSSSRCTSLACVRALAAAATIGSVGAFSVPPLAGFHVGRPQVAPLQKPSLSCSTRRACALQSAKVDRATFAHDVQKLMIPITPTFQTVESTHEITTFYPASQRVVALGDVHGDSYALSTVLLNAGLINDEGAWVGEDSVLVQVGDVLDRGPDEAFCLSLLMRLQKEAREVGGDVIMLLGNHEVMNSDLDYRYVDPLGWLGWDEESDQVLAVQMANGLKGKKGKKGDTKKEDKVEVKNPNWKALLDKAAELAEKVKRPAVRALPLFMQGRIKALGGREGALANMPVVVTVGSTVFCHAGVMPEVVAYGLQRLNDETSAYLRGDSAKKPLLLDAIPQISPIWHREFGKDSLEFDERALEAADGAMRLLGCKRMVIGHTPQSSGINCVCTREGREIWRVDTGMSQGIAQGPLETLEIQGDGKPEEAVTIFHGNTRVPAEIRTVQGGVEKGMSLEKELHMMRVKDAVFGKTTDFAALAKSVSALTPVPGEDAIPGEGRHRAKLAPYMRPRAEV